MVKSRSIPEERALKRREVKTEYDVFQTKQRVHELLEIERIRDAMSNFYAGIDPRRRREMADGGMVEEDHNAMANLSPIAIHREYPRGGFYANPFNDDTTLV